MGGLPFCFPERQVVLDPLAKDQLTPRLRGMQGALNRDWAQGVWQNFQMQSVAMAPDKRGKGGHEGDALAQCIAWACGCKLTAVGKPGPAR